MASTGPAAAVRSSPVDHILEIQAPCSFPGPAQTGCARGSASLHRCGRRTSSSRAPKRRRRHGSRTRRSNGPTAFGSSLTSLLRSKTTGSSQRSSTRLNDARPWFGSETNPTDGKHVSTSSRDPSVELLSTTVTRQGTGRMPGRLENARQAFLEQAATVIVEDQNVRTIDRQGFHPSRKAVHPAT